jgi:hypothetical protein
MQSIQEKGYVLLALPSEELKPLYLLEKVSGGVVQNIHSHIKSLFQPAGKSLPSVAKNKKAPPELRSTEKLELNTGAKLNFLQALLRFFTGSISAEASYAKKGNVQLQMTDLRKDYVDVMELDSYIQQAKPNVTASFEESLQKGNLYVVTEILKTSHFSMGEEKMSDFKLKAGAKAPGVAEGEVGFGYTKDKDNLMQGDGDLTIGLKAYQIFYRDGKYTLKYADNLTQARGDQFPATKLDGEDGFVTIQN